MSSPGSFGGSISRQQLNPHRWETRSVVAFLTVSMSMLAVGWFPDAIAAAEGETTATASTATTTTASTATTTTASTATTTTASTATTTTASTATTTTTVSATASVATDPTAGSTTTDSAVTASTTTGASPTSTAATSVSTTGGGGVPGPGDDGQDGGEGQDQDGDAVDPLAGEGQSEEAPGTDVTVPPPETYGGQEPYRPPEILWSSVAEAERKLERAQEARRDVVADVRALRLRSKHLSLDQDALDEETRLTIAELDAATDRYRGRAVADYRLFVAHIGPEMSTGIGSLGLDRALQARRESRLAAAALRVGEDDLETLGRLRQELSGEAVELVESTRMVADLVDLALGQVAEVEDDIDQAAIEYEAFRAGSEVFIDGVLFPIGGPYGQPLIDSFGFPRMAGTVDEHWHEGIDIFAPRGTPLVATERGLVTRIGNGRLGGLKLWLIGESRTEWYYAHLDSFAADLVDGSVVEAGDLLGYVGNTGNALGTPPHLHLQMHPSGGRPVNPYPLLSVVSRSDQESIAAGTHPAWRHEPHVVERTPVAAGGTP